ncbi:MAG: hypothetical protein AMXMBFR58_20600 [Phycisphaerae bacterium]|nr:Dodecaprenyl-phosphate galacturonate synthase [Phycisphaerales bacterium]
MSRLPNAVPERSPAPPARSPESDHELDLSVVAPAHNEEENIETLVEEVRRACAAANLPRGWEFLVVDDGSTDSTGARLRSLMVTRPWLRCVRMTQTPPGRGNGQSAAFHAGFRAARGGLIAVLDADLQNDPAEIPQMIELLRTRHADMVQGDRSHARKDNAIRRVGSAVGRWFRRMILADSIRDTGCSLRVMKREIALRLPLEFAGMHRFIPVSARKMGYTVVEMPVRHRPRTAGTTKYGFGITKRALPGLIDCFAVRWMSKRRRPVSSHEVGVDVGVAGASPEVDSKTGPKDRLPSDDVLSTSA